jgi:hypothetical protein
VKLWRPSPVYWYLYPALRVIEIHDRAGIRDATGAALDEERLFPGLRFSLSLTALFDENPEA